jgi:hypothetical protein
VRVVKVALVGVVVGLSRLVQEWDPRFDITDGREGPNERMSVDVIQSLHTFVFMVKSTLRDEERLDHPLMAPQLSWREMQMRSVYVS